MTTTQKTPAGSTARNEMALAVLPERMPEIPQEKMTEVLNNKGASDATYARAVAKFGEQGVIDVLGVAGYYALLAMVMNVARTAVPEGSPLPLSSLPLRAQSL